MVHMAAVVAGWSTIGTFHAIMEAWKPQTTRTKVEKEIAGIRTVRLWLAPARWRLSQVISWISKKRSKMVHSRSLSEQETTVGLVMIQVSSPTETTAPTIWITLSLWWASEPTKLPSIRQLLTSTNTTVGLACQADAERTRSGDDTSWLPIVARERWLKKALQVVRLWCKITGSFRTLGEQAGVTEVSSNWQLRMAMVSQVWTVLLSRSSLSQFEYN